MATLAQQRAETAPELVGREAELGTVHDLADGLMRGRGAVLWIEGEPGIGKTALVDALLAQVGALGAPGLRAWGDELMEAFPLRLMAACLGVSGRAPDEARREIAGLLGGQVGAGGSQAADPLLAAGERMLELVDRLCGRGPLVLAVEDLQWSDEPSLRVWGRLARTVDQIPLLLVGVTRPTPQRQPVQRLRDSVRDAGGTILEPGALNTAHAALLAERIADAPPGPLLRTELERAGGNPLYVRSLVEALLGEGLVTIGPAPDGAAAAVAEFTGAPGVVPDSLAQAVGRRLGVLSREAVKVLRLAALLGPRFDPAQLAAVAGIPLLQVADMMAEAVAAGVVDDGERLSFRHEVIRQVLIRQTPAALHRALHGHIARTLAESGAGSDLVARQLLAMPGDLDPWVLDWLLREPSASLYGAPSVAAELLARALPVAAQNDDPRWEPLAAARMQALFLLGRDEEVVATGQEVARRTRDVDLGARAAVYSVRSAGRVGWAQQALDIAGVALADEGLPLSWRSRLLSASALVLASAGRGEEKDERARAALAAAQRSGDAFSIAYAHHAMSIGIRFDEALEHARQGIAVLGDDPDSADLRILMTYNRLIWLFQQGHMQQFEQLLEQALVLAERVGTVRTSAILGAAATVAYLRGDWDKALVYLDSIEPDYLMTPDEVHLHGLAALIELHRGDRDAAGRHMAAIDLLVPPDPENLTRRVIYIFEARAVAAEADGDAARALELLASWLDTPPGLRRDERNEETPYLVRMALAAGDRSLARAATEGMEADAAARPVSRRVITAQCCRGQLDDDVPLLLAVAEDARASGWPFARAFALEEAAARLAVAGQTIQARAALTEAVQVYGQLGAAWDIRRVDARLRSDGVRRGPRSAHRRETSGWGALTPSESRIAQLVGQGWSNPDIAAELYLSRRTVQTHVSNILTKLQLHSRIEVVRALAQHGGTAPLTSSAT
jgi:DNA-binding CsgD family transcriptional regulator